MHQSLPAEFQRLVDQAPAVRRESVRLALQKVCSMGITTIDDLVTCLPNLSREPLGDALHALVHLGRRRAIPPLLILLEHSDPSIRCLVIRRLEDLRGERSFRALSRCLNQDTDSSVRYEAAHQLRWFQDDRLCDLFLAVLLNRDEDSRIRGQAAEGLRCCPSCRDRRTRLYKRAVRGLIDCLTDLSPEVRFWCCYSLGQLRAREALPYLQKLVDEDTEICPGWWLVRDEASDAIASIRGKPWPARDRITVRVAGPAD